MATKHVEALFGPYAGRIIALDEADAKSAISDGWARDPYDPAAETKEVDHNKAAAAAEKAARKLRGEDEPSKPKAKQEQPATEKAATPEPEKGATYKTRQSETKE
ncbi:hypothetical protein [Sinorhizobium medicae]|uniref:hypothetical protein n=1 Tax=Sinorhizobium medicae TaxID=110321 RepID=UPI000FD78DCD|nr:hypothetical protein [Sinorhizobium medicae]MDX0609391.1 hypothetical protein [Sinorhizobium medicae]MDX0621276.1 hypothetical protein [Sinorhizobium medicae]MDX0640522.1 hypothetical protein [Sinorhizobium medicae]MDX0666911.1 hypothetical protein [Sinorhizobium medicae]MDX0678494.1 hypothetical protein [Sinorhizobium medicae]